MLEIVPLFPIPLACVNVGPLDTLNLTWMKSLEFPSGKAARDENDNNLPEESKGMYFLHKPQMKSLKSRIEKSIEDFVQQLDVEMDLEITTSWLNKTDTNDWIENHIHECSIISGVYYPEVDSTTSPIIFNKSKSYTNLFHNTVKPKTKNYNFYNMDSYQMSPKTGDLFMFPSHLEHEVPVNSVNARYSVGFNTFAKGTVGVGQSRVTINE
jgi:uncharacterized protein (TIGR02466 family)